MAINTAQIQAVLNSKRVDFSSFQASATGYLAQYRTAWKEWVALSDSARDLWTLSQQKQDDDALCSLGARVLEPIAPANHGIIRSNLAWNNREQSLAWVAEQLTDVTTFAVDGSQVFPQKDFSIPIALVQIGWFENHHCSE
ncbi:MAG: NurA domain-containing protein, partial [Cyanobacteria bacterium J06576_12]